MRVEPLQIPQLALSEPRPDRSGGPETGSFAGYLESAIEAVDSLAKKAHELESAFAAGELSDIHQVTIAAQEAEIALELVLAVRNKVIEAYQEIMRMSI
jgi:flagellar hook-basal body complex protein FliE